MQKKLIFHFTVNSVKTGHLRQRLSPWLPEATKSEDKGLTP